MIDKNKDPMGQAIADFWKNGVAGRLRVFSPDFDEDEIPVNVLYREYDEMPPIEQKALYMAHGRILDVGAGSGCHSLVLQDMNKDVKAIDISQLCVETMMERGVKKAEVQDFFSVSDEQYDTILMLMNGAGIIGKIENLPKFFAHIKTILAPEGQLLMDSSDIRYVFEEEDGSFEINLNECYYGELEYQMQYKRMIGDSFLWLYIDFETLQYYAEEAGFDCQLVEEGEHYDYLCNLTLKNRK